jgi:hypothetical protein
VPETHTDFVPCLFNGLPLGQPRPVRANSSMALLCFVESMTSPYQLKSRRATPTHIFNIDRDIPDRIWHPQKPEVLKQRINSNRNGQKALPTRGPETLSERTQTW